MSNIDEVLDKLKAHLRLNKSNFYISFYSSEDCIFDDAFDFDCLIHEIEKFKSTLRNV